MRTRLLLVCLGCAAPPPAEVAPPSEARLELNDGMEALREGEIELGLDLCEGALVLAGGDQELQGEAHSWLVHGYTLVDDPERALEHAALAIELRPDDPWLRYSQGIARQKLGLFDEALDSLDRAIELDSTHVKAHQWRAHILQSSGQYIDAAEVWSRALEILESADEAVLASWGGDRDRMIATCLRARGECEDAIGK